jgi:hypothetical protein
MFYISHLKSHSSDGSGSSGGTTLKITVLPSVKPSTWNEKMFLYKLWDGIVYVEYNRNYLMISQQWIKSGKDWLDTSLAERCVNDIIFLIYDC